MTRGRAAMLLLAVFLLGAGSGVMGTIALGRLRTARFPANRIERMAVRRLAHRLDLDDEQRRMVRQITARARNQMERIREDSLARVDAVLDQAYDEIRPTLRPDQVEKLDRIRQEARRRLRRQGGPDGPRQAPGGEPPGRPVN